jgi:hypothetical protein
VLKQEMKNRHNVTETTFSLPSKYTPKEQCIMPAEVAHKDASYIERVPTAALSTQALPAAPIPAAMALTELSYGDVAAAGIPPSGSTPLPDQDGFKTIT